MKPKDERIGIHLKMPLDDFLRLCDIIKKYDKQLWQVFLTELKKQIPKELY